MALEGRLYNGLCNSFFFSSRRRHTRSKRDWSSDVCSSDLFALPRLIAAQRHTHYPIVVNQVHYSLAVREPERAGLLAYCQANDVLLVAWKPLPPLDPPGPLLAARKSAVEGEGRE